MGEKTWDEKRRTAISFYAARRRCSEKTHPSYPRYGAKGIQFKFGSCKEISDEIGFRPAGTTLDRIDSRKHYEAGNVRWATPKQQQENTRCFKLTGELIRKIKQYQIRGLHVGEVGMILGLSRMTASRGFKYAKSL